MACDAEDLGRPPDDHFDAPAPDPLHAPDAGTITPVVFVPSDRSASESDLNAVRGAIADLDSWYQRELGTARLAIDGLQVVHGDRRAAEYRDNNGIWTYAPDELRKKLGFSPWDSGHIVLLVGVGLEGWAGGSGNGQAGFAVLGIESLTNQAKCAGEWWCNADMWRGTAIHELGHALTLPHSDLPSIMAFHGDYINKRLIDNDKWPERRTITGLPFARPNSPAPAQGAVNGTLCVDNLECMSRVCGCSTDGEMRCLADQFEIKPCTPEPSPSTLPNWAGCVSDEDCISQWCGCHPDTGDTVCLPHSGYPKACPEPTIEDWQPCSADLQCISRTCGCNYGPQTLCLPGPEYVGECT